MHLRPMTTFAGNPTAAHRRRTSDAQNGPTTTPKQLSDCLKWRHNGAFWMALRTALQMAPPKAPPVALQIVPRTCLKMVLQKVPPMVPERHRNGGWGTPWTAPEQRLKTALEIAPELPKTAQILCYLSFKRYFWWGWNRLWYQLLFIFDLHYHQNICRIYLSIHLEHAFIHMEHTRIHFWILVEDVWIF